jgi:hypothetical protein
MSKWIKSKFPGVRFREHPNRKHGITAEKYYTITYKLDGKTKTGSCRLASEASSQVIAQNFSQLSNAIKRLVVVLALLQKHESKNCLKKRLDTKRKKNSPHSAKKTS